MSFSVRMYRQELPEKDDLVMTKVKSMQDYFAFMTLLEYNNLEAMIVPSDVSRKRIKSMRSCLSVGKQYVMQVLDVDVERGNVSLTKKYLTEDDVNEYNEYYTKSKTVHNIAKYIASQTNIPLSKLLEDLFWPLYDRYDHAVEGLIQIRDDPTTVQEFDLEQEVRDLLLKEVQNRFQLRPVKIFSNIEINCFNEKGIDAIKTALITGRDCESNVDITLLKTPIFNVSTTDKNQQVGIQKIEHVLATIQNHIEEMGGSFLQKTDIKICEK